MREKPRDKERLQHILDAIENLERFTQDTEYQNFLNNEMLQYSVAKCFEIIGEAAHHTTKALRKKHTPIEWEKMISFRNVLVHDYYMIDHDTVWKTIKNVIPKLKRDMNNLLKELCR